MIDKNKLDEMMKIAEKNNLDESKVNDIMKNLSEKDKQKVNDVLNDKEKLNKILADSNVQALIKKFSKGNG
ncbi:MAG: hypothetical protein ACI39F_07495 [Acutalibacteraceae bacterium]